MPETEVLEQPITKDFGYREDSTDQEFEIEDTEQEEEFGKPEFIAEKPAEVKPAEVPAEAKPEVKIEAEKPVEQPAAEQKPPEVTATDWKKVLKESKADKYEALKEFGYDDWTIDMLKYKDSVGSFDEYVKIKGIDYTKLSPEEIIKIDLQKQNPGMSERALNFKLQKELNEKYYLNRDDYPEDSDEAIYGAEQLRLDGENKRKAFIDEQNKFKAPEPQPDLDQTKRDAELQQQRASIGASVMNSDATKNLQTAKTITFGEGEASFNYPIADVQPLVDTALNTILASGRTDLTGVDMNAFYKQLAYGADMKGVEKLFIEHGEALAKKKFQSELGNVTPPGNTSSPEIKQARDWGYKTK